MLLENSNQMFIPELPVILEFNSSLGALLGNDTDLNEALLEAMTGELAQLLHTLGIPGQPTISIVTTAPGRFLSDPLLQVSVNDSICRYPDELLRSIHGYLIGRQPQPTVNPNMILGWLQELADEQSKMPGPNRQMLVDFLVIGCIEIIKLTPANLLGQSQVEAYVASLPSPTESPSVPWPPTATWLMPILGALLDLRISVADQQVISNILSGSSGRSQMDVLEDLIVALRPQVIEIQLPREYLKQLTLADPGNGMEMFPFLREGMFTELGMRYPAFHFTLTEHLKPNSFAFQINHLLTPPFVGLLADQCLVNETAERVSLMGIEARPASNPATGQPGSVAALEWKEKLETQSLTTWDQMGFLILSFAEVLRKHGACFLDRQVTAEQLDQLSKAFPAVTRTLQSAVSVEQVTRVLRGLIAEQLSIRNLTFLIERLLDYYFAYAVEHRSNNEVTSDEPQRDSLTSLMLFMRAGLTGYISNKYARGTKTIVAYLLDPALERRLTKLGSLDVNEIDKSAPSDEEEATRILEAIRTEASYLPPTAQVPVLLTTPEARPALAKLVRRSLPRMSVVSHQELLPNFNVQPVARILYP